VRCVCAEVFGNGGGGWGVTLAGLGLALSHHSPLSGGLNLLRGLGLPHLGVSRESHCGTCSAYRTADKRQTSGLPSLIQGRSLVCPFPRHPPRTGPGAHQLPAGPVPRIWEARGLLGCSGGRTASEACEQSCAERQCGSCRGSCLGAGAWGRKRSRVWSLILTAPAGIRALAPAFRSARSHAALGR